MSTPEDAGPEPSDVPLGQKAVELGLITERQFRDLLAQLSRTPSTGDAPPTLASALVRFGLLTQRQMEALSEDTAAIRKKFGKYTIVRQLGRGAMGVVFEAIDAGLGRTVALKMLLNNPQGDPEESARDEERFVREARLSASLPKHPGIVGVYESGILEGRRYIAMEYVEGCHFEEWRSKSTGSLRSQIALLRDVAVAVDHAHRHGVIHRDLKPANVLVDTKGRPHVTDFGLARQIREDASLTLTGGGRVMGTPTYISPEQASGRKDVDRRTDIWALGIMLFELLAGRPPFRGETPVDVMMKIVKNPVPSPSVIARGSSLRSFDSGIENICLKALSKDPRDRYSTAKLLATDLSRWLKGETVDFAAPKKSAALPVPWIVAGIVGAVAVVLLVMLSSPSSADKAQMVRRERAAAFVTQGEHLLGQGKNADALIAFGQAYELDSDNQSATAGKREAERRIAASHVAPAAAPAAPPPPPVAPPPPGPRDLLKKATEFSLANPKDIEGQIRAWQEAKTAAAGTPFAPEAARELEAALARRRQSVENELSELDHAVEALRDAESFAAAREVLAQASKRHDDPEWVTAVEGRKSDLRKQLEALYGPIRDHAAEAKRRGDSGAVDSSRTRVAKWKDPDFVADLEEALAKVVPAPRPPPPRPDAEPIRPLPMPELPQLEAHRSGICSSAFSPDGRLMITASFDMTVRLWDLVTRKEKSKLIESTEMPRSVAFSPDGKWLAAGFMDGKVRLWDSAKLQERTLSGHTLQAIGVAFSSDSKTLASASTDGSVRLWDPVEASPK